MLIPKEYVDINDLLVLFATRLFNEDDFESEDVYRNYIEYVQNYAYAEHKYCLTIDYPLAQFKYRCKEISNILGDIPPSYLIYELELIDLITRNFFEEKKNIDTLIKEFLNNYSALVKCESKSSEINDYKIVLTEHTKNNLHRYGHFIDKWGDEEDDVKKKLRIRFKAHIAIHYFKRTLINNNFKINLYNNVYGFIEAPSYIWNQPYLTNNFYSQYSDSGKNLYDIKFIVNEKEKECLQVHALVEKKVYNELAESTFFEDTQKGLHNVALNNIGDVKNKDTSKSNKSVIEEHYMRPWWDEFRKYIKEELRKFYSKDDDIYTDETTARKIVVLYDKYNFYKEYKDRFINKIPNTLKTNKNEPHELAYAFARFLKPKKDEVINFEINTSWEDFIDSLIQKLKKESFCCYQPRSLIICKVSSYYKEYEFYNKFKDFYSDKHIQEHLSKRNAEAIAKIITPCGK